MSLSQQANVLQRQQHISCFCALSSLCRIFGKSFFLIVEVAVAVSTAVDVVYIVAIPGVIVCALQTLSVSQIQYPFVKTLNLYSFNTILNSIDKILSTEMKKKFMSTYFPFFRKYNNCDQNVNISIPHSWAPLRPLLTSNLATTPV